MIYLDNGATSFRKPASVKKAVLDAMEHCANPGRGGYGAAMEAARRVYRCRELAGKLFSCQPEQVVFTANCTHGLNIAIRTLVRPGGTVVISGFEHNAVTRPLHAMGARVQVAGRKLFDPADTLGEFEKALRGGAAAAVFTHVSNVFGYVLPVRELSQLCQKYGVPFIIDAAQSAGAREVNMEALGADFIAMPGHKGLLGPQGTGILLCGRNIEPLICGGTGNLSIQQEMPADLPERGEAGTVNVPGICGLHAGLEYLLQTGVGNIGNREAQQAKYCAAGLKKLGFTVFSGEHQGGTVSFVPDSDCEEAASRLAKMGIAVRAGLHCAPLAHESAGTLETGTIRVSFGHDAASWQTEKLLQAAEKLKMKS